MSKGLFANTVALVTGGATGIGRATCRALAGHGARVVFTGLADDEGAKAQADLRADGLEGLFVRSDATLESDVESLMARIVDTFGRLDVAINVVGDIPRPDRATALLHETSEEGWDATVNVCLKSTFLCMKHEIAVMLRQGGGVIANTASLAGLHSRPTGRPPITPPRPASSTSPARPRSITPPGGSA